MPHVLFGDDVFHQVLIEVRAAPESQVWRKPAKKGVNDQRVHTSEVVMIRAIF